jgi:hypothetical protein
MGMTFGVEGGHGASTTSGGRKLADIRLKLLQDFRKSPKKNKLLTRVESLQ